MKILGQEKNNLYTNNEEKLNGMFPFGKGGFWHSGIHLHYDAPLNVPLEGEVVAFRIADKYQINSKAKNVSNSFVLMKHNVDLIKSAEKTENSKIEFFSLYTTLCPDSELKLVKEYKDSKVLSNGNIKLNLPFYKDVKFFINQEKCNSYRKLKNEDFYVGSEGYITESSFLTNRSLGKQVNVSLCDKNLNLSSNAIKIENSTKSYKVKVENEGVQYYPTNTDSNVFFSRGTVKKDHIFFCNSEPIIVNSQKFYKIKSNGTILQHKVKTGYIFQCETYQNNTKSEFAYVQEDLKYSILYDAKEVLNLNDYLFICKYSELKKFVHDINNRNWLNAFLANLGFGVSKDQLNRSISDNINSDVKNRELKDNDLIFICNNKYYWNLNEKSKERKNQVFYDISFKNKVDSYAIFYVEPTVFKDISDNVTSYSDKTINVVEISAIKENNGQYSCAILNENTEIDSKNCINLLTNNLLYHVNTHLPTTYNTEWLINAKDLKLLEGPNFVLVDDGISFTNSQKGLMLYNKNNKNLPAILIDKPSESFSALDSNSILENNGATSHLINYKGIEYLINVSDLEQLKMQIINKPDFKTNEVIKPSGDKGIFLTTNHILGYASENDGQKSFDFITFTKDVSYLNVKDKLMIRIPKINSEILSVKRNLENITQRLPYYSMLKIICKEEVLGHYYYKVKYSQIPIWFLSDELESNGGNFKIKSNFSSCWISFLKINSNGSNSGNNEWTNNQQLSILIDLITNNFESFKGKSFKFLQKNKKGSSYSLSVDFEQFSNEYYIEDISNFTLNEKDKTLTIKERNKDFVLFTTNPFEVNKVTNSEQNKNLCKTFTCDEGALLKYNNIEYYALVNNNSSLKPKIDYYIKKNDIEEKNLLDWNEYFKLYDKDTNDDVYYDLTEILDSCNLEKDTLERLKNNLKEITGKNKNQESIKKIYADNEAREKLRNLIVKHPLEFNKDLFKKDEVQKITPSENDANNFVNDMNLVSFWNDIAEIKGIDKNTSLYFTHPVTFFNRINDIKDRTVPYLYEKWGSRITGKNGNIFILDGGKGKLLSNVEWFSQRDNAGDASKKVYGWNMCQLTSLAMVMNAMGIKRKRSDCQFEDELYNIANHAGYGGSKLWEETITVYKNVLSQYDEGKYKIKDFYSNIIENTKKIIDNGIPVIKSMNYKSNHTGGHVTVVVGYIGNNFIVNDPYGNRNTGNCSGSNYCSETNGSFVEYPFNKWDYDTKWGCYLDK